MSEFVSCHKLDGGGGGGQKPAPPVAPLFKGGLLTVSTLKQLSSEVKMKKMSTYFPKVIVYKLRILIYIWNLIHHLMERVQSFKHSRHVPLTKEKSARFLQPFMP